jgi:hypothetical protein
MLFAPRQGVVSKLAHRASLSLRIIQEDIIGLLYRLEELGRNEVTRDRGLLPLVKCRIGTATCCSLPRVSVKRKSTNLTSFSFAIFKASSAVMDICRSPEFVQWDTAALGGPTRR